LQAIKIFYKDTLLLIIFLLKEGCVLIETGWSSITVINILLGIIVLTLGCRLYWFFVGFIGFAVGYHYATSVWQLQSQLLLIGLAALTGIIGVVLAVFFQKIAVGLAGFVGGGYISLNLINLLGVRLDQLIWLPHIVGGLIGAMLMFFIFDWALIFISSLAGASMIIQVLSLNPGMEIGLFYSKKMLYRDPHQNKGGMR
jgi:hypothetical protein